MQVKEKLWDVPVTFIFCSFLALLKFIQDSKRFTSVLQFSKQERFSVISVRKLLFIFLQSEKVLR